MPAVVPPGCYGVVRTSGVFPALIRFATRSEFDHAFIVIDGERIIEAQPGGARLNRLSAYSNGDVLFNTGEPLSGLERKQIIDKAGTLLGTPYGWADIIRLGLRTVGVQWPWLTHAADVEKAMICSQIVAACGAAAGLDWNCGREAPAAVTPGDLAKRITTKAWKRR